MRLLESSSSAGKFILTKDFIDDDEVPPYAILSHTWVEGEEVTFDDLINDTGKDRLGYEKIRFCGERARRDGLQYFWVDTCCINKANFTELSQAINSMFHWYQNATKCYVYLSDISTTKQKSSDQSSNFSWESAFRVSRWFTRGWTLQELLAPDSVEFFSRDGGWLGNKEILERQICEITGIPGQALRGTPLPSFGVDERMSWAKHRRTTRKEDEVYSLLGIFNAHMPLIYGEGRDNALARLREVIDRPSKGLNRLPYVAEAPFNSYTKQHQPTCLPDTRVDLLRTIYDWANRHDEMYIFWLSGLAGTGKSTIARTVARKYFEKKRLGASFFFQRNGGDVGHAGKFCTTIAVQLANHIPTLREDICKAISNYSDIASLSLHDQWRQLVLKPLSKLDGNSCLSWYILVIDALDECDNDKNIRIILQLLAEVRSLQRVQLRVFLTSRSEVPIRYGYYQVPENERYNIVLHNISPSIIEHDISTFFEYHLRLVGVENAQDPCWPGAEVIKTLVHNAGGLFIWAATACRFIRDGLFADERLRILLQGDVSATATPEEHLNEIYVTVLQNSIQPAFSQQDKDRFCGILRDILGSIVALSSPLPVDSLSRLLATPKHRVDRILKDLHAILDIPEQPMRPLRLHHPSFREFLLSKERCGDLNFWVDKKQAHQTLVERCIQLMSACLKQDMCGLDALGVLATDLESSRVRLHLPPEVQYACLYWVEHLCKSGTQLNDNDQVHQFLQIHFLHWLEALSWMLRMSEAIIAIIRLESIALTFDCPQLYAFIHDMKRFALHGRSAIEKAPLQVYCSALIFAPIKSTVKKQFEDKVPTWMRRLSKVQEEWSALLITLEGHTDPVKSVAFSPDGALLASTSDDRTIRLWDTVTGAALNTLEGHMDCVNLVVFSLNGKLLASASSDTTIRLWDAATGVALNTLLANTLTGQRDWVNSVAFSNDSTLLVSALSDGTVRLWDTVTGTLRNTLKGHTDWVNSVAFSHDSALLVSTSSDGTVRLWDTTTGTLQNTLKGHTDWVNSVAFSHDGALLASASSDDTVRLWDVATGALRNTLEGHTDWVRSVAFSHDGAQLASASSDTTIMLWDVATGSALNTLKGHTGGVRSTTFSPDGVLLASASIDGTVRLWNATIGAGAAINTLDSHTDWVNSIVFSHDGTLLASASSDTTVMLWDAATGTLLRILEGHTDWVKLVVFSYDGTLLASASDDDTVRLWDVSTGAVQKTMTNLFVDFLSFSSDGLFLETSSGRLPLDGLEGRYPLDISPPQFIPRSQLSVDEYWVMWNSEKLLWLPPGYRGNCLAFGGNVLALGHADGRITFMEFG